MSEQTTNLKVTMVGTVAKRIKETRNEREYFYLIVKVKNGQYEDTFKCKAKDAESVKPYAVGERVYIEAFVHGRDWTNQQTNKKSYFTDIGIWKIGKFVVEEEPPKPEQPASVPASEDDDIPF